MACDWWLIPEKNESIEAYAAHGPNIAEPDPVLVGVSFGGHGSGNESPFGC